MLTQAGELYVGNMVDTTYSLVASPGSCAVEKGGNVSPH